jgi:hypothetical protein
MLFFFFEIKRIEDLFYTLAMFIGPHIVEDSIDMLQHHWNYTFVERKQQIINLDPSYIDSGDYFAIRRFDGLDPVVCDSASIHS